MRQVFTFVRLVIDRTFEKSMWYYHAAEFLLYFYGRKHPEIPEHAWFVVFLCVLLSSFYRVWRDEKALNGALQSEIKKIKDEVPKFGIVVGEIHQFDIKPLIDAARTRVESAQTAANAERAANKLSSFGTFGTLQSSAMTLMFGNETAEEKLEYAASHYKRLQKYEEKIKHLYQIDLTISGNRSDENVETWLECDAVEKMIVENNYPQKHVPELRSKHNHHLLPPTITSVALQNKLWLSSYASGKKAHSKIADLNADRPLALFDEDFFVITDQPTIKIKAKITSQKRHTMQHTTLVVPLKNAPVVTIEPYKPRTYEEITGELE